MNKLTMCISRWIVLCTTYNYIEMKFSCTNTKPSSAIHSKNEKEYDDDDDGEKEVNETPNQNALRDGS